MSDYTLGSKLDKIAATLERIAVVLERKYPAPKPGCIMHDTDDECRVDSNYCRV